MLGAIAGDIIGSRFEWNNIKTKEFELFTAESEFTDDTVLTVALADSLMSGTQYTEKLKEYYSAYPHAGYGGMFHRWAQSESTRPYNSFGNGSAMRVSPVGWYFGDMDTVLEEAKESSAVTHSHPEGLKGAQAVAAAIFLARTGESKESIAKFVAEQFSYDLTEPLDEIRTWYHFDVTCQGSVPQAIIAFLESTDFEDAIRNAISIGGDSDTLACITGSIAEAYYGGLPGWVGSEVRGRLDDKLSGVVDAWDARSVEACAHP